VAQSRIFFGRSQALTSSRFTF